VTAVEEAPDHEEAPDLVRPSHTPSRTSVSARVDVCDLVGEGLVVSGARMVGAEQGVAQVAVGVVAATPALTCQPAELGVRRPANACSVP